MIRIVHAIRRKPGMEAAEFRAYWLNHHGPLVAGHQVRLGMLRHVQTHRDPASAEIDEPFRNLRGGMEAPHDGVAETWWASESALAEALSSEAGRRANAELIADEANFIDHAASPLWLAHEYPQVNTQRHPVVARPKTGVVKLFFPLRQLPALSAETAQRYWRIEHGPLVRSFAVARGMLCYQQVHRYDSALAEPLRAARGVQVEPYLGHAEAWMDRLVPRAGPDFNESVEAALDDETKFIDWSRSTAWIGKELVFVDRS